MDTLIVYRMEIVGGPFDGVAGMAWHDDGQAPVPEVILLGMCPGDRSCGSQSRESCAATRRRKHPAYWTPEEKTKPVKTTPYELTEAFTLERNASHRPGEVPARAIYVIGNLKMPRDRDALELVGVGGSDGKLAPEQRPIHAGYPGTLAHQPRRNP